MEDLFSDSSTEPPSSSQVRVLGSNHSLALLLKREEWNHSYFKIICILRFLYKYLKLELAKPRLVSDYLKYLRIRKLYLSFLK